MISILISTRNRAELLAKALESIHGQGYSNTEVVVVDDASTDDTPAIMGNYPWARSHRIERAGGYRDDPAPVFNLMMGLGQGDVLIQQSAEVIHLTPVATELAAAVERGTVAFATVLNGQPHQLPAVAAAVQAGWRGMDFEWTGAKAERGYVSRTEWHPAGGQGTAIPPPALTVGSEPVEMYTGHARAVPFFFCGAIHHDDWHHVVGRYTEGLSGIASDLYLVLRMVDLGFRFRFLGNAVAYHMLHVKS